ncbi:ATP-dependent zinc metalloprotease FtsH [Parasynechococcus marenigrum]|uniref:ATP-dependent zinc metalloprotease FtsH n=1 Tax=Parasynechococcus marenigrum (strain WH8102) TaxID=84588 RepID=Q7U6X5_PARMW|nr:cell division protein FtsH4 [Parasynechococcus marenigrum WH 8102]
MSVVRTPCVKSLRSRQFNVVVTSGSEGSEKTLSPQSLTSLFGEKPKSVSYSSLLEQIRNGDVSTLELVPARREVRVTYPDGTKSTVSIFVNDQQILRAAEASATPLTVRDIRGEQAMAGLLGNLGLVLLLVVGLSFLLRRSAQMANRALGFGRSQPRLKPQEDLQVRFEDVAGINDAKEELEEVVTFLKQPESFTGLGAKIPRGVLLVGPPGTGKTLLARAIAGEAEVPFFSMAASEFVELFVGVGASRVRDLFRQAKEKSPCIVFIDEIDAVGRQRGAGIGGGNDEREQTLNQLLTEMDGFADNSGVILLAATNRADVLDAALTRPGRFDRRIDVSLPDRRGREEILGVHARTRPLDPEIDLTAWARRTPGFSGAELANLINEAAILTAREQQPFISDRQLEGALERITMGLSAKPLQDSAKKRLIAYHEVGHALVAALLPAANKLDKVTILPRGAAGGYTRFMPDEEKLDSGLITRASCLADLVVSLGGRAAELVVFGPLEITQGASGDLQMVSQLAREMVTRFGFSSLGPVALEGPGTEVFLGRDWFSQRPGYAESTGQAIDTRVRDLAKQSLDQAVALLESRRDVMDRLVDALMEEETLHHDRFMELAGLG